MACRVFRAVAGALLAVTILAAGFARPDDPKPEPPPRKLAPAVLDGRWLRPAKETPAEPVWGIKDGIAVGLWPTNGPRGLVRVYAPYLGQRRPRMVNFISVEPVVKGDRGQSELEVGTVSKRRGLAMWTGASLADVARPREATAPSRGLIERMGGTEALTFYVATEPFRNGARPVIQVILRADRPHEVGLRVHAAKDSAAMEACVLSATMGNYARLRRLWLRGEVVDARKVWPEFEPDPLGFAPWREWPRDRLLRRDGNIMVAATSDEANPAGAEYDPKVPRNWRYQGKPATQYWRTADVKGAVVRVNGRTTYWGDNGKVPGGVSYENFEVEAPFSDGQEFWFGVTPAGPDKLGFDPEWEKNVTGGK